MNKKNLLALPASRQNSRMLSSAATAKNKPNFVFQLLIFLGVFVVFSIIASVVASLLLAFYMAANPGYLAQITDGATVDTSAMMSTRVGYLGNLFITIFEILIPVIYCRFIEKRPLRSMGFIGSSFPDYFKGLAVGCVQILAAAGIGFALNTITFRAASSVNLPIILVILAGYLIQGCAEEVLVRGYLMTSLTNAFKGKLAVPLAVVISSIVFACLHLGNPGMTVLSFVNLFLAGVFFAVLVLRTDSIWCAAAAHTAWNFTQGHILGFEVSGLESADTIIESTLTGKDFITGGSFGLEGGILVTIVLTVSILLTILLPRKIKFEAPAAEAVEAPAAESAAIEAPVYTAPVYGAPAAEIPAAEAAEAVEAPAAE